MAMRSLFIILFVTLNIAVYGQTKGDQLYQSAKALLNDGQQAKAIKTFADARKQYLSENNFYRYFVATQALSIIYQDTGDGVSAEAIIKEAEKTIPQNSPENLEIHAKLKDNLAYTYLFILNKSEEAIRSYDECILYYEKAGKVNSLDIAFELVNRSVALASVSRFHKAIDDMTQAIAIYEKDPATSAASIAAYYQSVGLNYMEISDFDSALKSLTKALEQLKSPEDDEMIAILNGNIGSVYSYKGDFVLALEYYHRANHSNELLFGKTNGAYAEVLINSGNVYEQMGDWEQALTSFQEVLTIYQQSPPENLNHVVDLFLDLSRLTDDLGLSEQSEAIQQQALTFAINFIGKNSVAEANVYQSMAATAHNHGAYDLSLSYNFKALSIAEEAGDANILDQAIIHGNIGQAYDELNELDLAFEYKNRSIELYTRIYGAGHSSTGMAIGNLAHTFELKEEFQNAIETLRRSLGILEKSLPSNRDKVGVTLMDIGLMHFKLNDVKSALTYFEQAKPTFDGYDKNVNKAKLYNRLSIAYNYDGQCKKAEEFVQKAIIANTYNFDDGNFDESPPSPEFLNYYEIVTSYINKANLFGIRGGEGNLLKGLKVLDAADLVIKQRAFDLASRKDRLELAQLSGFFSEAGVLLADKLFHQTKDPLYIEKAFYFSERGKANELLAEIQLNRAYAGTRIPKKFRKRIEEITSRLNALSQQLALAHLSKSNVLIQKLKTEEFNLSGEFELIQKQIESVAPSLKNFGSHRAVLTWQEINKSIPVTTALISYSITDSAKFIFIGTHADLIMKAIPLNTNFDKLLRGYSNTIKFQSASISDISGRLTQLLWRPVEEELSNYPAITNLIIIPDGPLHLLPFESLGGEKHVIEKYTVQYQPSASLLALQKPSAKNARPSIIAMAPVFADKQTNFVNKSCQRFVKSAHDTDSATRAFTLDGQYVSPLPATKREVEQIRSLYTDRGSFSKGFLETDAREELVKKGELSNFDYIHLATHGFVNSQYPELSGLLLTQDVSSAEDGVLYSGEVSSLDLKADLVTLSACETALGKRIKGEGVRGLTTAFLFAGANTVVASLWKVADESTSILMIEFYKNLLAGKDKATALQQAKLHLMRDEKYSHPYYWAPFIQIGGN